jgi:hypothetical protein
MLRLLIIFGLFAIVGAVKADVDPLGDDGPIVPIDDKPIIPPVDQVIKAVNVAQTAYNGGDWQAAIDEDVWRIGAYRFLNDNMTLNLSNTTGMFFA